uniref:Uncharacterized protein n=1 Tax=Candidatus Kentrum sp. LFY TaxID=2126342 RepID=A0A450UHS7_9GAMM|nr:MAG: hypothetical protein BECKLFY1418A_GA0070994_102030 [Candidatus Kentron sp. LFY]
MNMLALRARTEAGWVLAYAPILSESLVFPIPKYEVRRERIFLLGISSERIVSLRER